MNIYNLIPLFGYLFSFIHTYVTEVNSPLSNTKVHSNTATTFTGCSCAQWQLLHQNFTRPSLCFVVMTYPLF